jgi:hypothetical protein
LVTFSKVSIGQVGAAAQGGVETPRAASPARKAHGAAALKYQNFVKITSKLTKSNANAKIMKFLFHRKFHKV